MSKFRFREYDALGLQRRVPGDALPVAHHISKRKQKQKNVEVVFDVKDYKWVSIARCLAFDTDFVTLCMNGRRLLATWLVPWSL